MAVGPNFVDSGGVETPESVGYRSSSQALGLFLVSFAHGNSALQGAGRECVVKVRPLVTAEVAVY